MEHLQNILNNELFAYTLLFILGSCLASFFNVFSLRFNKINESNNAKEVKAWLDELGIDPIEQINNLIVKYSISFPSSHCYSCKNPLKWYHNIPVFSWIFLGGKCGHCKQKISCQYPLVEIVGGLLATLSYTYMYNGNAITFIVLLSFVMLTYLLLITDINTLMLPDELNYFILWGGLTLSIYGLGILNINSEEAILGAVIGYCSLFIIAKIGKLIKGEDAMGGGDLKLLAAIGAFVGIKGILFTLFLAPFLGIITWIISKLLGKYGKQIPFGPALIVSSWIYIADGENLISTFYRYII